MKVLVKNDIVEKYPYSLTDLQRDNPGTSFPSKPSDSLLMEWGVFDVAQVTRPDENYNNNVIETIPQKINGVWTQVWLVTSANDDEIAERTEQKSVQIRLERNSKLSDSDWTQLADSAADKSAWATYRQALRDVPAQLGFPWTVIWPVKPN